MTKPKKMLFWAGYVNAHKNLALNLLVKYFLFYSTIKIMLVESRHIYTG